VKTPEQYVTDYCGANEMTNHRALLRDLFAQCAREARAAALEEAAANLDMHAVRHEADTTVGKVLRFTAKHLRALANEGGDK
jgi:hypothetical protein